MNQYLLLIPEIYSQNYIRTNEIEPEKNYQFKIPWMNDQVETKVNRKFPCAFNSQMGL